MEVKVIKIMEPQTGVSERGEWKSQDVVVEAQQNVQYPDRYLLTFKGANVDKFAGLKEGDVVNAEWSSMVREFTTKDGRKGCSQQHVCWKCELVGF